MDSKAARTFPGSVWKDTTLLLGSHTLRLHPSASELGCHCIAALLLQPSKFHVWKWGVTVALEIPVASKVVGLLKCHASPRRSTVARAFSHRDIELIRS
jgi:hypothetical protein